MPTDFTKLKPKLDLPSWQPMKLIVTPAGALLTGAAGSSLASDLRASQYNLPYIWFLQASTVLMQYDTRSAGWLQQASPALTGVFGAGATSVFAPSQGPRGTIASGATPTSITLSTALPASVSAQQLAGQRLRIVNNIAGGGKTYEVTILSNTAGTTPTITFATITDTPATGATYEFLTGRLYMLSAGTLAAGMWKYFDLCTSSYSGNLATTNLPTPVNTDSAILSLDELHTPITGANGANIGGEVGGYFGLLNATAVSSTTITGQAASGDATVAANEYRNFQIRIIQDTVNPTAVGQRRRITSHTAGASPVYTVPSWSVTPSTSAKYYIENNNDIVLWSSASTNTFRYDPVANTWDTTTYAARPAAIGTGVTAFHAFGLTQDSAKNLKYSNIYSFRGGASASLDMLDISAAATGSWSGDVAYGNRGLALFSTGGACCYSAVSNTTMCMPLATLSDQPNICLFDVNTMTLRPYIRCPLTSSTAVVGERVAVDNYIDGTDRKTFFYHLPSTQTYMLRSLLFV